MSKNLCLFIGFTGEPREPIKKINDTELLEISIAVQDEYDKNKDRDKQETLWLPVKVWGKRARYIWDNLSKGTLVSVSGRLRVDKWEKNGVWHQKPYLKLESWDTLKKNDKNPVYSSGSGSNEKSAPRRQQNSRDELPMPDYDNGGFDLGDDDDDLPPF